MFESFSLRSLTGYLYNLEVLFIRSYYVGFDNAGGGRLRDGILCH